MSFLSVCIANYNGEDIIGECIDSVRAQTSALNVQIIVHDDASEDDSVALIKSAYPDVKLIVSDSNVGYCVANNRMVNAADGDWVLLLNNDACLFEDAVETICRLQSERPDAGVIGLRQFDLETGAIVDTGCGLDIFHNPVPLVGPRKSDDVAMIIGACLAVSKSVWETAGGFPEWFHAIAEDMYLCCATRLVGLKVTVPATSGYLHRQGVSYGGNRPDQGRLKTTTRRRYFSERNKLSVLITTFPTIMMWPLLFLHCATLIAEGGLLSVLKRSPAIFRSIYAAAVYWQWKRRAVLLKTRKRLMRRGHVGLLEYLSAFSWRIRKLDMLWRFGVPEIRSRQK